MIRALSGTAIVVAVVLTLAPLTTALPAAGLDPSWGLVLERGFLDGWQWGRDLIFTFGPYGFLYQRLYHPDLMAWVFGATLLRCLLIGIGIAILTRGADRIAAIAAVAAALLALPVSGDGPYLLLPLLAVLVALRGDDDGAPWYPAMVAGYLGLAALIKTTFAVLGLALLVVLDVDRVLRRRPPLFTPIWLASALSFYLLAGQSLDGLLAYIVLALEVAAGFSHAMSLFSSAQSVEVTVLRAVELGAFLAASLVVLALVAVTLRAARRMSARDVLLLSALAAFWFVTYKAGFTRHDLHTLMSWAAVGVAAALVACIRPVPRWSGALAVLGLLIAFCAPARLAVEPDAGLPRVVLQTVVLNPLATLREGWTIVSEPSRWSAGRQAARQAALDTIRRDEALPDLEGTVDSIPSIQAALIAAVGERYQPRPVFQEYSTYTERLIALNAAALAGSRAPDSLLIAPARSTGAIRHWPKGRSGKPSCTTTRRRDAPVRSATWMIGSRS
jgi:hypothetical protein